MNRRLREFFSLMAVLIITGMLLSACGQPKPPQTVTIQLDSNPTTGYSWQVSQTEDLFDIESSYTADETEEVLDGIGGTETFVLTAKKPGTCEVSFSYVRPWEETGEPDEQVVYTFKVSRNLQVEMLSAVGYSSEFPIGTPSPEIK